MVFLLQLLQAVNKGYFKTNGQVFEESFWMDKIDKEADLTKFMRLQTALTILGLVDEFLEYFHVLFAILHLLAIKFIEVESTEENKENLSNQMCAKFVVSEETMPHLTEASLILGLDKSRLHNSLIFHTFAAG
jgi:myosin heavy subunit